MAGKGKKGRGRPLLSNMLEGMGELGSQKVGKWLGDFILSLIPGLVAALGVLNKDSILDVVPYIGTFFVQNEILQDSTEGFLRGISDSLRAKRNDIPDDPAQQKAFFVSLFGPTFDKLKADLEGKKGQKPKGLLVAAAGLTSEEQRTLWQLIASKLDEVLKFAFSSDISTAELRVLLGMGKAEAVKWIIVRLTPPPKPETITSRIEGVMTKVGHRGFERAERLLDPDGSDWKGLTTDLNTTADEDELRLRILNRHR